MYVKTIATEVAIALWLSGHKYKYQCGQETKVSAYCGACYNYQAPAQPLFDRIFSQERSPPFFALVYSFFTY
jgi:hypothetical protein